MHDLHSDYPVAHEKIQLKKDMLSGYQVQIIERNNLSLGVNKVNSQSRQQKKIQTPQSKSKTFLSLGLQLKKISWSLRTQTRAIFETICRTKYRFAKSGKKCNKIKKQIVKSRNNAIFGKSIENPLIKAGVKIATTRKQYLNWSFRLNFKREK